MNESVHVTIAANIRALRTARGWSVRQLAEECAARGMPSLTHPSLTNVERRGATPGGREPRRVNVAELVFLADLFEVTPNDLFNMPDWKPCEACNGTGRVLIEKGEPR